MINPQIITNVATALNKSELKPDNKALKDNLNTKENTLTGTLKKNLGLNSSKSIQLVNAGDEDLNLKLKNLVNKVLDQLFAKNSPNEKLAKQSDKLNFAPNFSNEIKFLVSEMKKSDIFTELLSKLEQILKPISEVKADNLAPLFKNSGVFFEAKLKDALSPDTLPKSFHSLLNAIKSLSSPKITSEIITLATKDLDPKSSLNELKNIINIQKDENKAILQHTNFKTLLALSSKLENFKNYISKNPNFAQNHIKELATNILRQLNKLETNFKQELKRPENLAFKDSKFLKDLNQSFTQLVNTLKALSKGDFSSLNKSNSPKLDQNTPTQKVSFAESQKPEFIPTNEADQESNSSNVKAGVKTNEKANLNKTNTPKSAQESKNVQDEKTNAKDESAKITQSNTKTNIEPNDILKTNNPAQATLKQENTQPKPTTTPPNPNQSEVDNENPLKNSDQSSIKNDNTQSNSPNLKENMSNKNDINQANKSSPQEKPMPTQANVSENKFTQEKTAPLNEQPRFTQNETQQVKNLIFTTEKAQMPELEHLSKELAILSRRTNEGLKQLDNNAQNAKINLTDIKNLEHKIEQAAKDLSQITPKNTTDISNELKNDIKSTLLQVSNLAKNEGNDAVANQANRLLAQIEFNQLMSLANESINTYLPLFWEDLNESKVIFKRGKKDKYFAQIKLNFAKLGELDILIALKQDKYLDINIMAEHKAFRKTIYEHSHELRRALNKAGLLSSNFFVGDIIRSKLAPQNTERNYEFQMGIDKKA